MAATTSRAGALSSRRREGGPCRRRDRARACLRRARAAAGCRRVADRANRRSTSVVFVCVISVTPVTPYEARRSLAARTGGVVVPINARSSASKSNNRPSPFSSSAVERRAVENPESSRAMLNSHRHVGHAAVQPGAIDVARDAVVIADAPDPTVGGSPCRAAPRSTSPRSSRPAARTPPNAAMPRTTTGAGGDR